MTIYISLLIFILINVYIQNGNVVDALTVFKRNVNLHFDGVGDCVICYSIISVVDRSIPTKQCRTCRNKFHASCLYKVYFFFFFILKKIYLSHIKTIFSHFFFIILTLFQWFRSSNSASCPLCRSIIQKSFIISIACLQYQPQLILINITSYTLSFYIFINIISFHEGFFQNNIPILYFNTAVKK